VSTLVSEQCVEVQLRTQCNTTASPIPLTQIATGRFTLHRP